jgi:hypothetical protein
MASNPTPHGPVILVPGHFYRSRNSEVWCCFSLDEKKQKHCQADCVRVSDHRVEYFYVDGRYDGAGQREHTLISEVIERP